VIFSKPSVAMLAETTERVAFLASIRPNTAAAMHMHGKSSSDHTVFDREYA